MRCLRPLLGSLLLTTVLSATEPVSVQYGKDDKQSLRIYPAAAIAPGQPSPVVIWVHGGGWRNGDKDNRAGIHLCQRWAQQGCVVVGIDYRLTPAVVHPAHVQDVAAGIAWVHQNIAPHGGDPQRIFLLGHSAGAHLVALVATAPQYLKAHDLSPKMTLAGVMAIDTASYDLTKTRTPAVRKMVLDSFGSDPNTLNEASPLQHARKHPDECPRFLIAAVKQRPEAVSESKALNEVLPESTLVIVDYPGMGQLAAHGQIAKDLADFEKDLTKNLLTFVQESHGSVK